MFTEGQRVRLKQSGVTGKFRNYGTNPVSKNQLAVVITDSQSNRLPTADDEKNAGPLYKAFETLPVDEKGNPYVFAVVVPVDQVEAA